MNTTVRREDTNRSTSKFPHPAISANNQFADECEELALLEKCKSGDMAAWDILVRKFEKPVFRFAFSLCKNAEDAADISGHVFVRVYKNLHTFRHESCFSSWLFRIVRNTHLDMCIRPSWRSDVSLESDAGTDGKTGKSIASDIIDPADSPEALCLKKEVSKLLAQAIKHLPGYQREVIQMYHSDGKSYEEIAATTGLSIGTVKSRLNRARTMLRERLMPYRDTLTSA